MQTFDQSLFDLYKNGLVALRDAMSVASHPHDFRIALQQAGSAQRRSDRGEAPVAWRRDPRAAAAAARRDAGPRPSASTRPGTSSTWSAASCATRSSAATADRSDLDFTTDARPERDQGARRAAGPTRCGPRASASARSAARRAAQLRDHDPPGRGVPPGLAQARRACSPTPIEADLSRRDFTVNAMALALPGAASSSIRSTAPPTWPPTGCARRSRPRSLHRRPAAHAAGRPVHRRLRARCRIPSSPPRSAIAGRLEIVSVSWADQGPLKGRPQFRIVRAGPGQPQVLAQRARENVRVLGHPADGGAPRPRGSR